MLPPSARALPSVSGMVRQALGRQPSPPLAAMADVLAAASQTQLAKSQAAIQRERVAATEAGRRHAAEQLAAGAPLELQALGTVLSDDFDQAAGKTYAAGLVLSAREDLVSLEQRYDADPDGYNSAYAETRARLMGQLPDDLAVGFGLELDALAGAGRVRVAARQASNQRDQLLANMLGEVERATGMAAQSARIGDEAAVAVASSQVDSLLEGGAAVGLTPLQITARRRDIRAAVADGEAWHAFGQALGQSPAAAAAVLRRLSETVDDRQGGPARAAMLSRMAARMAAAEGAIEATRRAALSDLRQELGDVVSVLDAGRLPAGLDDLRDRLSGDDPELARLRAVLARAEADHAAVADFAALSPEAQAAALKELLDQPADRRRMERDRKLASIAAAATTELQRELAREVADAVAILAAGEQPASIAALRARLVAGDHAGLVEELDQALADHATEAVFSAAPADDQAAALAGLDDLPVADRADLAHRRRLIKIHEQTINDARQRPMDLALAAGAIEAPAPLAAADPASWAARRGLVSTIRAHTGNSGAVPLTKAEASALGAALADGDAGARAQIMSSMVLGLGPQEALGVLGAVADDAPLLAGAGALFAQDNELGRQTLEGLDLLAAGQIRPSAAAVEAAASAHLGPAFARLPRSRPVAIQLALALHAQRQARTGLISSDLEPEDLAPLLDAVTGGVITVNGQQTLAPAPGVSGGDVEAALSRLGQDQLRALGGPIYATDRIQWVRARDLVYAQLIAVGRGEYEVLLGGGYLLRGDGEGLWRIRWADLQQQVGAQ